jgi:nucleoside-diphosphate kinase
MTTIDQPNITFAMIKSDAFRNDVDGAILRELRAAGYIVVHSIRRHSFTTQKIEMFYAEHRGRPYFPDLTTSVGLLVLPMILECLGPKSAINQLRLFIGATNPRNADVGTIRAKYGGHNFDPNAPIAENAIHASDSLTSMLREINMVFGDDLVKINSTRYGEFYLEDLDPSVIYPT